MQVGLSEVHYDHCVIYNTILFIVKKVRDYLNVELNMLLMWYVLCFEVDKISKILIKTLNAKEYIELDIQNTEAPRTYDTII